MQRPAITVLIIILLLFSSFALLGSSSAVTPREQLNSVGGQSSFLPQGLQVESNGTVVVSGLAVVHGSYFTTQYAGHGALFVSGNFIVEAGSTLLTYNLSIVFVKKASLLNDGKIYLNNSVITSYNLSMNAYPPLTINNYGTFTGNNTSLQFRGTFNSKSSTVTLTNGYYGRPGLSFQTEFSNTNLIFDKAKVYGNLGSGNLVNMNISGGNLYAYDTFFNIRYVLNNSASTVKYPGGVINLDLSNAYFLNFSMPVTPPVNKSYTFPMYTASGNAYFFDSVSVTLSSPEGYPVYNVPFAFGESSSPYLNSVNVGFYGNEYTKEFAPFPSSIGQNTIIYGIVDILDASGLFVYDLYYLNLLGQNQSVHFPAFPVFDGTSLSMVVSVPVLYVQVSAVNLTYSVTSVVKVNYTSYGSVSGTMGVSIGNEKIYSHTISSSSGVFTTVPISFSPTLQPGNYSLNVSFDGTSYYSFVPLSVPVTIHQDFFAQLGLSTNYSLSGGTQASAVVSVFVNLSGQFPSSTGLLNLVVNDSQGSHNFTSLIPIYPGMRSVFPFYSPVKEPGTSVVVYRVSLTPVLTFTLKNVYLKYLNQSLDANLIGEKSGIIQTGVGEATFYLNFSIDSLGVLNEWVLYQNQIAVDSGNITPGYENVTVPAVSGENYMTLELNGNNASVANSSTSFSTSFNFAPITIVGTAPPYILENQSTSLSLLLSGTGSIPLNEFRFLLNNNTIMLTSSSPTVSILGGVNVVQVYENVMGTYIMMAERTFISTVVPLPNFVVNSAQSLVGNYHIALTLATDSNTSINSMYIEGVGQSYSHLVTGNNETFFFHSKFSKFGTFQKIMVLTGTYKSLQFNVSMPVNVSVLYPSYSIAIVGSPVVQFGIRSVEIKLVNLNGTGYFGPTSFRVTGRGLLGGEYQWIYNETPQSNGEIRVSLPLDFGSYHVSAQLHEGGALRQISAANTINIELLVLPFWAYIVVIVGIAAVAGVYSFRFFRRSHGKRKKEKTFICYNCGRPVPFDAKICPHCRVKFSDQVKCGDCGSEIPRTMDYCPYCGNVMRQGIKLANYLKKKYRDYIAENRKDLEKSLGKVEDDVFWKRLSRGVLPIKKFEDFRAEFLVSGKYDLKGVIQCPVCGSGNLISDDQCAICGAPMHLIVAYDRKIKGENEGKREEEKD